MAKCVGLGKIVHLVRDFTITGLLHYCWLKLSRKELLVVGSCLCCGNCCRALNLEGPSGWLRSKKTFKKLLTRNPEFKRFEITGHDGSGYLLFRCNRLDDNGLCGDYENRPSVCLDFPHKDLLFCGGTLPTGCGYGFVEITSFNKILKKKMKEINITGTK